MELVIDAGIVFTGVTGKGITKDIIFSSAVSLSSPQYLLEEIEEHMHRLHELSKLPFEQLDGLLARIKSKIKPIPKSEFEGFLAKANSLISDKDDTEYLALSLAFNKMPIWSNDPHFKQQKKVKVFSTKELVEYLESMGYKFSTSA